jgi:hypothetical protein
MNKGGVNKMNVLKFKRAIISNMLILISVLTR